MFFFKQVSWTFLLSLCFQLSIANASSVQQVSIDDMLGVAEFVFEGRVTSVQSDWNSNRSAINTVVTFEIIDIIQGDYDSDNIELSFAGGSAGETIMQVHGMIYPELGEQGIYFVEQKNRVFVNPMVGWSQGHFLIIKDRNGQQKMMTADHKPIIEMTNDTPPAQALSEGVAAGLRTNRNVSELENAMSKTLFKEALQEKILNRGPR